MVETGVDADGNPLLQQLDMDKWTVFEPAVVTEDLLRDLDGVDLSSDLEAQAEAAEAEVPAVRVVDDPEEMDLIGDGLPIIHGVSRGCLVGGPSRSRHF